MDDTALAFMIFATEHPDALAQVRGLSEAEALEAGEPLSAQRDTMVVQTLTAEASKQGVSLDELVQTLIGRDDVEEGDATVPGLEKYNRKHPSIILTGSPHTRWPIVETAIFEGLQWVDSCRSTRTRAPAHPM